MKTGKTVKYVRAFALGSGFAKSEVVLCDTDPPPSMATLVHTS